MKKNFSLLIILIIFLFIPFINVNAEVSNFNVFWRNSVPSEIIQYSDNSVWSGVINTINQQSTFKPYLTIYMCETGYVNVSNIQNVKGRLNFVSKGNTQNECKLSNGFDGHLEYYIFYISDYDTSSGAYMTNTWKMDIQSTVNYNNFQQILGISTSDSASSISDYYSILNQLWYQLDALKNNSNATQSSIDNLQSSINALQSSVLTGQEEIKANQQETNEKLDRIDETIKDDNIDSSLGNSFFGDFSDIDHGGLSSIITAPLNSINAMLSGTCRPLTTTFKGKEIKLPCGTDFWNKITPIKNFLNVAIGGFLCYLILIKLYQLIDRLKDPEDDRVDVMKL